MKRLGFLAVVALTLALPFAASASTGWKVVRKSSASGQFAVTATSASITRPKAIAVRYIGRVSGGMAVVACSKGFSISSNSRSHKRAGLFVLPIMRGADSCDVTASVSGSGRVTVQILRR